MNALASELIGRRVAAIDGDVGRIEDLFIDDERWVVRFLVVDTGDWLTSRRVLLSPASAVADAPAQGPLPMALTREQIERSPDVDTQKPVSRQYEIAHALHYGYDTYWTGPMLWGATMLPSLRHGMVPGVVPGLVRPPLGSAPANAEVPSEVQELARQAEEAAQRSHLRSAREIIGYRVVARDGSVGTLDDLVVERPSWSVPELVVDAKPWWPGGHVRVPSSLQAEIDWSGRMLRLQCDRDAVPKTAAES
jgi:sporulation protein YlmC with PRC-barrel domain